MISIKRVYVPALPSDGRRILVDGIWPRGIKKEALLLDEWMKEIAPSLELRKWFGHQPERWSEFVTRYRAELEEPPRADHLNRLQEFAETGTVTLLFAARDETCNNAVVIRDLLLEG